jgi:hypothetical protein
MNWQVVVESIGIFGVGSGILAWLIRSLAKHALDKDLKAFEHGLRVAHEINMEEAKNRFTVGATSHMANVVFDKHVAFCEEYAAEAYAAMQLLFRKGPTEEILESETKLLAVRTRWAIWLPPDLEEKLTMFQKNLLTIGAYAPPRQEDGPPSIDLRKSYNAFAAAMGWPVYQGEKVTEGVAVEQAIRELSKILGVWELTGLRAKLISRAIGEGQTREQMKR